MIVVDVNLLVYASNVDSPPHGRALDWWRRTLSGEETIGLPWSVLLGFLRITTNPRAQHRPLTPAQAMDAIDEWFRQPIVRIIEPTPRHWEIVKELVAQVGTAGNLTSDAHLAALAIEHEAVLCSTDRDFDDFEGLRWTNPLSLATGARERARSPRQPVAARR